MLSTTYQQGLHHENNFFNTKEDVIIKDLVNKKQIQFLKEKT